MKNSSKPVIAVSNKVFPSVELLIRYCIEQDVSGIDYTFNPAAKNISDLQKETAEIEKILKQGFEVRYHLQFYSMEIADADIQKARESLELHKDCVDLSASLGGEYATIHIGLGMKSLDEIKYETALVHLSELIHYGREKKVTVCLENLTNGWTNNPKNFLEMIKKTNAAVTFDLGHANACPWVANHHGTSVEFLETVASHVINAHVYEIEKIDYKTGSPYHVAPQNLNLIRPLLSGLTDTRCDWWLIELTSKEEVTHTLTLLRSFLSDTNNKDKPFTESVY